MPLPTDKIERDRVYRGADGTTRKVLYPYGVERTVYPRGRGPRETHVRYRGGGDAGPASKTASLEDFAAWAVEDVTDQCAPAGTAGGIVKARKP